MSQMDTVSPAFVASLAGSLEWIVSVDVWADGELVAAALDVTAGSVTVTDGQAIRSRVSLTVADPDGLIRPTGDDSTISPYGPQLHVKAGLKIGPRTEMVSLGWFPIVDVQVTQSWRTYTSAGDTILVPSGTVDIEATDRAQWISEFTFTKRLGPSQPTVLAELGRLLAGVVPWQPPSDVDDEALTSRAAYDGTRMEACTALADRLDCDLIASPAGAMTVRPRAWGDPVWTLAGGDKGVLASWTRRLSRDGTYNYVVAYGADPTSGLAPKVGRAWQQDGPLRYREGLRISYTSSSPILTTQSQVDKAAVTTLARLTRQRTQTVTVECSPNPALDAGDVVTLQAPRGSIPVRIASMTLPLTPGRMQLTCEADPVLLGQVA